MEIFLSVVQWLRCRIGFLLILLFVLLAGGCAKKNNVEEVIPSAFFDAPVPTETDVIIEPGDELSVLFYYHPEFNTTQVVRADGKIALTLYQGVQASGKTPDEFQAQLVKAYSTEFVDPVITVEIKKNASENVFVTGEVRNGGMKQIQFNMTIASLLAQSGVNYVDGDMGEVILVRKYSKEEYRTYKLDARIEGGPDRDIFIKPGDIVYVPRNGITLAGDFVQKYIRDLIPPYMNLEMGTIGIDVKW